MKKLFFLPRLFALNVKLALMISNNCSGTSLGIFKIMLDQNFMFRFLPLLFLD